MRDANNNVLTGRVVTWSSSNPLVSTVSASGLVTVIAVGGATITATSETKTGTSAITGVLGGGGSGWRGNEPTGMTAVRERAFNSLNEDASWDTDASLSIASDASAPHSASNVLRATYPAGFGGGSSPGHTGTIHTAYSKIYLCFALRVSSNWVGNGSTVNKVVLEWTASPAHPSFVFSASGSGGGTLIPQIRLQDIVTFPGGNGNLNPNLVPSAQIVRGQWYQIEVFIQGNSTGKADGVIDWFMNGVHVGSVGGIGWTSGATTFNLFEFNPIWGGTNNSPAITSTQTMDMDHVYVSGRN
jgi:hypothetical protein